MTWNKKYIDAIMAFLCYSLKTYSSDLSNFLMRARFLQNFAKKNPQITSFTFGSPEKEIRKHKN